MPAKDIFHDAVINALTRDGWVITHDPYTISMGQKKVFVDLGAKRMLAAEKNNQKIAIEIKSFRHASELHDLEQAVGQYALYHALLVRLDPERQLFLAVPHQVYENIFTEPIARPVLEDLNIRMFTFDTQKETIVRWIT